MSANLKKLQEFVDKMKSTSSLNEKKEIIQEAKQIVDLKELVSSILLVSELSRQKE